jgi:hypothetical protein
MIRSAIILLCLLAVSNLTKAQLCPGGGASFSSAIMFDPAWIYGCNTGSSCNGGVNFDNRFSCEPAITMDACAAQPSCTLPAQNASDIWFKFYPSFANVTIACIQNTSMVIGIQAFSGGTCGGLTQIGCALAAGPSSGVQLNLTGLTPGQLYYFRIYGSSHTNPQRTGIYCFCGTTGIRATILPLSLETLKAVVHNNSVELSFQKPSPDDIAAYDIEHSTDGINFQSIYRLTKQSNNINNNRVSFVHTGAGNGTNYYRLRRASGNSRQYSTVVLKISFESKAWHITDDRAHKQLVISLSRASSLTIADMSGRTLRFSILNPGLHHISTASLAPGAYIAYNKESGQAYRFVIAG